MLSRSGRRDTYLGTTDIVVSIAAGSGTTTSAIDALGERVAVSAAGTGGFLLPDLHGNTAGALNSGASSITDAFACDAYGNTVAAVTSGLPTPWRYQGRMLESAPGSADLYDFGSRSYSPSIGTFTSLDSEHGSAGNPALLNGYLYANANPATLVDPDGHAARMYDEVAPRHRTQAEVDDRNEWGYIHNAANQKPASIQDAGFVVSGPGGVAPERAASAPQHPLSMCEKDATSYSCEQWQLHVVYGLAPVRRTDPLSRLGLLEPLLLILGRGEVAEGRV
jgi:RHS repeat-associated protein